MKVIAINTSARKNGNTATLIQHVFQVLEKHDIETEVIELADKIIEPCKACWACGGRGNCVHAKDTFQQIFEKIKEADAIILASPTYSANVSSTMQAILERATVVCDMNPGILKHKVGAGIIASRRGGALNAFDTLNHFFLNHEMFVVGSSYWNIAYGRLSKEVEQDTEGIQTMYDLGENLAYLMHALQK